MLEIHVHTRSVLLGFSDNMPYVLLWNIDIFDEIVGLFEGLIWGGLNVSRIYKKLLDLIDSVKHFFAGRKWCPGHVHAVFSGGHPS